MQTKVLLTLVIVDMYTINMPKHFSIVWAITMEGTNKKNHIAVINLHKCGIERARIFELLKPLNMSIMNVFVNHTVKLFLDVGRVSDHERSGSYATGY